MSRSVVVRSGCSRWPSPSGRSAASGVPSPPGQGRGRRGDRPGGRVPQEGAGGRGGAGRTRSIRTTSWGSPRWRAWPCWRTGPNRPTRRSSRPPRSVKRPGEAVGPDVRPRAGDPVPGPRAERAIGAERRVDPPPRGATGRGGRRGDVDLPGPAPDATTRQGGPPRGLAEAAAVAPDQAGDNSNTQFALLGIWAAGRHGFDPNESLGSIDGHFRGTQGPGGRWGYVPGDAGRDAMTCAGLMGLAIAAARPALAERQTARARGVALAADPAFTAALGAVARDANAIGPDSDIYYLWSLERVCVALGLRDLDGLDWYAVGARELLRRQSADGSWPDERWGKLPNTCLALLFLRKANLAFELDRGLKLPGARASRRRRPVPEGRTPAAEPAGDPGGRRLGRRHRGERRRLPRGRGRFRGQAARRLVPARRDRQGHPRHRGRRPRADPPVPGADDPRGPADHGRPGPRPEPEHGRGRPDRDAQAGGRDLLEGAPGRLARGRRGVRLGGREGLPVHRRFRAGPGRPSTGSRRPGRPGITTRWPSRST